MDRGFYLNQNEDIKRALLIGEDMHLIKKYFKENQIDEKQYLVYLESDSSENKDFEEEEKEFDQKPEVGEDENFSCVLCL